MSLQIIGGSGFLGTSLGDHLKEKKIDFNILDLHPRGPHVEDTLECDITDIESLKKNINSTCLINLAAVHRDDVEPKTLYDEVNVQGARNICQIAREKSVNKIIFVSSVAIYGSSSQINNEDAPINYFNDYGRTKFEAEKVFKDWFNEDKSRSLIILRPTVIFGPGNRGNIYNLLHQIYSKKFVMVGDGRNIKSICYVKNVASFLVYSLSLESGIHIYNYVDKPDFNMNQLVALIRRSLKQRNSVIRIPVFIGLFIGYIFDFFSRFLNKPLTLSSTRVKKFINSSQFETSIPIKTSFKAPYNLEDSLIETIKYEFLEDNLQKQIFETE